jgi:hypothetical protein
MLDTSPVPEPDHEQMRRHLEHLFGGWLDGCHEGRIELAWTDRDDGRLKHAVTFGTDEIDELIERAIAENRKPGQNVYVGQALRRPDVPQVGRCRDDDFLALPMLYVDIDDDVTTNAATECTRRACPPTAMVITGKHPHVRAQLLWRLDEPLRDADFCRQQNLSLAQGLGGDTSVVNPGRLLRLAGSTAWPVKPGRIIERVEFLEFNDGRPRQYMQEQIALAFPPTDVPSPVASVSTLSAPSLQIGSSNLSVDACLARVRLGEHWHDNILRLVGHWLSRGWSDTEILTLAEALTLSGYTAEQTRHEVAQMIAGGRRKWSIPNPVHAVDEATTRSGVDLLAWTAERYAGDAKPMRWLCTGTIPLGVPVLVAAMGGLGKSYLTLDLALNVAAGLAGLEQPRLIFGGRIATEGTAVIVTAEDGVDSIHRRLNRIDPTSRRLRRPERLIVVPLPDAGGIRPLISNDRRTLARSSFLDDLRGQLLQLEDLRLVVFDPLQSFVAADVNADPAAAQFLWSTMGELAVTTGATVLLTHHMRKDGMMRIADSDDAREAIRGTTALVDGARLAYALWRLDETVAKPICDQLTIPYERGRVVRGGVVKANDLADHTAHTYLRQDSGLLVQLETEPSRPATGSGPVTIVQARQTLAEIQRRFDAGVPFSHAAQSDTRFLGHYLTRQFGLSGKAAKQLITDWLNDGIVTIEVCDSKSKLKGLRVQRWI